eukprot:1184353-Prorocentrum_minimum.AAC.3
MSRPYIPSYHASAEYVNDLRDVSACQSAILLTRSLGCDWQLVILLTRSLGCDWQLVILLTRSLGCDWQLVILLVDDPEDCDFYPEMEVYNVNLNVVELDRRARS